MHSDEYRIMFEVEDTHWWYQALRSRLAAALDTHLGPSPARILDVGCGTGANLKLLAQQGTAFGIDIEPTALHFCRERGLTRSTVGSALALPFPAHTFDAVTAMDVLYHKAVPDKSAFLREVRRVLRPGGILILNVPAYQWLYSSHDAAVHTDRRFTRSEIAALMAQSEFVPLRTTYWNTFLFPIALVTRLWRRCFPPQTSDLDGKSNPFINRAFRDLLEFEKAIARYLPMPFGLSVLCVSRAPGLKDVKNAHEDC